MKSGKIGFGLAGTGMAGLIHAKEFPFVPDAELVAVCSRNPEKVRAFADTFGVKRWYTDYRDLIDDKDVDGCNEGVEVEREIRLGDIDDPWAYPQVRHRHQIRDMIEAIRENRDPILTGEDARVSLAINMAIYESSRTGKEVDFTRPPYALPEPAAPRRVV